MLRAYLVKFKDDDWCCLVVAYSRNQAKSVFCRDNPAPNYCQDDYIAIRAHLVKANIPVGTTGPHLFDDCMDADWICKAWSPNEFCGTCRMPGAEEKAKEYRNDYWTR